MADAKAALGKLGENAAAEELLRRGYRLRTRNYHCRGGEADLVAEDGEVLVFVEVKTRSTLRYGLPQEAVTPVKRRRLVLAAEAYLHAHAEEPGLEDRPVRFDVVEVVVLKGGIAGIRLLPNAFMPND
jgi:putative endonuclease